DLGVGGGALLVVNVGRLVPVKGQADLVRAWPLVLAARPDAVLAIAGEGPERGALEALARELQVAHALRLLGDRGDVPELVGAADVVVQASHEEALSNAVLEALAAARPVVATDVGGTGEVVRAGTTGVLVPPRDPAALAGAILSLAADRARARALGDAGRA